MTSFWRNNDVIIVSCVGRYVIAPELKNHEDGIRINKSLHHCIHKQLWFKRNENATWIRAKFTCVYIYIHYIYTMLLYNLVLTIPVRIIDGFQTWYWDASQRMKRNQYEQSCEVNIVHRSYAQWPRNKRPPGGSKPNHSPSQSNM